ncbi:unnamed protein product [Candida verbasci]|uniref:Uncharacterized protein n=1 Tax=Candida verbasci TaxID=1227364 RepID=A0A9W4U0Q0_9ASCO|nr:unnamed protein product [Candida verbasci]
MTNLSTTNYLVPQVHIHSTTPEEELKYLKFYNNQLLQENKKLKSINQNFSSLNQSLNAMNAYLSDSGLSLYEQNYELQLEISKLKQNEKALTEFIDYSKVQTQKLISNMNNLAIEKKQLMDKLNYENCENENLRKRIELFTENTNLELTKNKEFSNEQLEVLKSFFDGFIGFQAHTTEKTMNFNFELLHERFLIIFGQCCFRNCERCLKDETKLSQANKDTNNDFDAGGIVQLSEDGIDQFKED